MPDKKYMGPSTWPVLEDRKTKNGSGARWGAFVGFNLIRGPLHDEAVQRIHRINTDPNLTALGKENALRALSEEFHKWPEIVVDLNGNLDKLDARTNELRAKLAARPRPKPTNLEQLGEHFDASLRRDRSIRRYEVLQPAAKREAVRTAREAARAGDKGAETWLSDLLSEPGILDEISAKQIETDLQRLGDPETLAELEILAGKLQPDGTHDGLSGCVPVAKLTRDLFLQWLDSEARILPNQRNAEQVVDAATTDDAIVLDRDDLKDPETYRLARDRAQAEGKELQVEGGEAQPIQRDAEPADTNNGVIALSPSEARDPASFRAARDRAVAEGKTLEIKGE